MLRHWPTEEEANAALAEAHAAPRATQTPEIKSHRRTMWRVGCLSSLFTAPFTFLGVMALIEGLVHSLPVSVIIGLVFAPMWPGTIALLVKIARRPPRVLGSGKPAVARVTMANRGMKMLAPPSMRYVYRVGGKEHTGEFTAIDLQLPPPRSFIHVAIDPSAPKQSVPLFQEDPAGERHPRPSRGESACLG